MFLGILKSKSLGLEIYAAPPLFAEENPDARWELLKPLYGLATARKEWCDALRGFLTDLGWEVTLLGKSVFFWANGSCDYGFGEVLRDKCISW